MVTPPTRAKCQRLSQSTCPITALDRFGVPPHLWGRQKPASKELIERLVKPTTSHSQRCALTQQQYRYRA